MSRQSSILSQDKNAADKNSARVSAKITRFVDKAPLGCAWASECLGVSK